MKTESELTSNLPRAFRNSMLWDIYFPLVAAAVPAGLFMLLGFITKGLDKPGVVMPIWVIVAMFAVQTLGMISMAFVLLVKSDLGFRKLMASTNGRLHICRSAALRLSIVCLLVFDILTNVSAAFASAEFLFVVAVPVFVAYIVCDRIAFAGLGAL